MDIGSIFIVVIIEVVIAFLILQSINFSSTVLHVDCRFMPPVRFLECSLLYALAVLLADSGVIFVLALLLKSHARILVLFDGHKY